MGVVGALLILAAAHGYGAALLARAPSLRLGGRLERTVWRLGLGLGVLAYLVLVVGLLRAISLGTAIALVVVGLLLGLGPLRREWREGAWRGRWWPRGWPEWALAVLLAWLGFGLVVIALAPPAGYDELTYHLAAPKIYAAQGHVDVLPYDHHTAFAFTLEMLYTLGLLLGGAAAAKLLHLALAALALAALARLGREWFSARVGQIAVVLVATTPLVLTHLPLAYTEAGLMLWTLLALWAAGRWLGLGARREPRGWLVLAGVFAGLAGAVKVTALLLLFVIAGAVLVLGARDRRPGGRAALVVLAVGALVAAPWPLRAWVATGNPVFPFAHGVFQSPLWSDDRAESYETAQKEFGRALDPLKLTPLEPAGSQRQLSRLLLATWNVTFHPSWFYDVGHNMDGKARLGPAYLAFGLPFLALFALDCRRRRGPRRALGLLLAYGLVGGLFWFVAMQHLRYFVPNLAVFALLAAWAADRLTQQHLARWAVGLVLAVQIVGGLAYATTGARPALRWAKGELDDDRYAAAGLRSYRAMQWLNANPPAGTVAVYGEPRAYWLDVPYIWAERNHNTLIPDSARASAAAYLDYLHDQLGVTTVLVDEGIVPLTDPDAPGDTGLLATGVREGRLRQIYEDERYTVRVYALDAP